MFVGSIVALITPMDAQGNICESSLKKLIDYHVIHDTTAIVLVGTTGEFSTLSYEELSDVVMMSVEFADGRIPIIVGIGTNATSKAIRLIERFNNSNVAGYLTVTPYYNRPTQEGLFQHFKFISEHTELPQILYNVPSRTGCDMFPETVSRLAEIKNIIGIKEATGNLSRVNQIKRLVSDDFVLLSGDDVTALDFMQLGGHGVISVTANVAAHDMVEMCKCVAEGNFKDARAINQRLELLHKTLFIESNPIPVKYACKQLGLIIDDTLRLPMTTITKSNCNMVTIALRDAGLL